MGNTIVLVSVIVTLCFAGIFFLVGAAQGFKRSLVSLALVFISLVLAIALAKPVSDGIFGDGKLINDVVSKLPSDYSEYYDILIPLVKVLLQVVTCLGLVIACNIASIIVYCILKIFVRPGRDSEGNIKKHRLFGGLVGIIQGVVLSFSVLFLLCDLFGEVNKVKDLEINGNKLISVDTSQYNLDYNEFKESLPGSLYAKFGGTYFTQVSTGTDEDGKEITLSGQVDALVAAVKMANELQALSNITFDGGLDTDNVNDIVDMLKNLEDIKGDLSPESLETLDNIIHTVASDFELGIDLDNIDFATINYANEADVISKLYSYKDKTDLTAQDASDFVNTLAQSDIILPVLEDNNVSVPLSAENQAIVNAAIEGLTDVDSHTKEILSSIFGE